MRQTIHTVIDNRGIWEQNAIIQLKNEKQNKVIVSRPWQDKSFNSLFGKQCTILNTPTGSGKSICTIRTMIETLNTKKFKIKYCIVAVPQKVIGFGFSKTNKFLLSDGTEHHYTMLNDFCSNETVIDESKTKDVITRLRNDCGSGINDNIFLVTHKTLCNVFEILDETHELHLLDNTFLSIDEAHHSANDVNNKDVGNKLGEVVNYYVENRKKKNLFINLVTATLSRRDAIDIVNKKVIDEFERYNLDYATHFTENCEGLQFTYNILFDDCQNYYESIDKLLSKIEIGKMLIFIPRTNSRASTNKTKQEEVKHILEAISKCKVKSYHEDENGIIHLKCKDGTVKKVMDVVAEGSIRDTRLEYFRTHSEEIDIVIGMCVPIEGFDWPPLHQMIIVGERSSQSQFIQMIGRAFRNHIIKSFCENGFEIPVEIYHILPEINMNMKDKTNMGENVKNYMKAIYCGLVLEPIMKPIEMFLPSAKRENKEKVKKITDSYIENVGNKPEVFEEILKVLRDFERKNPNLKYDEKINKYIELTIQYFVDKGMDEEEAESLAEIVTKTWTSKLVDSPKFHGIKDMSKIDYDIAKEISPVLNFWFGYTNGICGANSLNDFKKIVDVYKSQTNNEAVEGFALGHLTDFYEKLKRFPSITAKNEDEKRLAKVSDRS